MAKKKTVKKASKSVRSVAKPLKVAKPVVSHSKHEEKKKHQDFLIIVLGGALLILFAIFLLR